MNKEEFQEEVDSNLYVQQILQEWMRNHAADFIKNPSDEALRHLNSLLLEIEEEVPLRYPGCKCLVKVLPPIKDSPTDMNRIVIAIVEVVCSGRSRLRRLYVDIPSDDVHLKPENLIDVNVSFDYSSFHRMDINP